MLTLQFGRIEKKVDQRTPEAAQKCFPVLLQHTDPCFIHVCEKTGKVILKYGAHVGPDPSQKASFGKYFAAIGYEPPQLFPDEILKMIFQNLNINEFFAAETVCKRWRMLIKKEWKRRCEIHFQPLIDQKRIMFQGWDNFTDSEQLFRALAFHRYHHEKNPFRNLFIGCLPLKLIDDPTRPWVGLDPKNKNPFGVAWFFSEYHLTQTFQSDTFSLSFNDVDIGDRYEMQLSKNNEVFTFQFRALRDEKRPLLDMKIVAGIGMDIENNMAGCHYKSNISNLQRQENEWNILPEFSLDQLLKMKHPILELSYL
jgi:hypothetical protein